MVIRSTREKGTDMPLYEHVFLARQDISAQQVEALTEQYKAVIEGAGGAVTKVEYWGVKSLAFRINKNRKAHYALMNLSAPAPAVAEMERQMRINENVLRFMTVRVEELEDGPSAMLQKRERDEKRDFDRDGAPPRGDRFERGPRRRDDEGSEEV